MATMRQKKNAYLSKAGFLPFERKELINQYTLPQLRRLPYLVNMIRSRRLNVGKSRAKGYSDTQIAKAIMAQYNRNHWKSLDDNYDVWQLLKRFRRQSIESGDYIPPKRGGSHHKGGISKGDVAAQKQRVRGREIEGYKTRIQIINLNIKNRNKMTIDQYESMLDEKERLQKKVDEWEK